MQTAKKQRTLSSDSEPAVLETIVIADEENDNSEDEEERCKERIENNLNSIPGTLNSNSENQESGNDSPVVTTTTPAHHLKRKFDAINHGSTPHGETIDLTDDNYVDLTHEDTVVPTQYPHFHQQVTGPELNTLRHTFLGFFPFCPPTFTHGDKFFLRTTTTPSSLHTTTTTTRIFDFEQTSDNESVLTSEDSGSECDTPSDEIEIPKQPLPNKDPKPPVIPTTIIISDSPEKKIKSIDTRTPSKQNLICSICLEKINNTTATVCGHIFCKVCIQNAIKKQKKCPLCRKNLTMNNIHPLFL